VAALGLNTTRKTDDARILNLYTNRGRPRRAAPTVRPTVPGTFAAANLIRDEYLDQSFFCVLTSTRLFTCGFPLELALN